MTEYEKALKELKRQVKYWEKEKIITYTLPPLKVAISAIEKQIPKKPKITINNGFCPQCKNALGRKEIEKASLTGFKYFGFCPICGQALDWGDSE